MLPGFSASSSLYRSRHVYAGHRMSPADDVVQMASNGGPGVGITGRTGGSSCPSENPCPAGFTCCDLASPSGLPTWNCFDLNSDNGNCGGCGHACNSQEACCNGRCKLQTDNACGCSEVPCSPGHKCCNVLVETSGGLRGVWKCINVTNDKENCGNCRHKCSHGEKCCGGSCCSSVCCNGKCCGPLGKCKNGKCCFSKGDVAGAAALMCLLTGGTNCNAIYQQLLQEVCP